MLCNSNLPGTHAGKSTLRNISPSPAVKTPNFVLGTGGKPSQTMAVAVKNIFAAKPEKHKSGIGNR
jgi:hypothetical protein